MKNMYFFHFLWTLFGADGSIWHVNLTAEELCTVHWKEGNKDTRAGVGHRCYGQNEKWVREELNVKKDKTKMIYIVQPVLASVTKVDMVGGTLLKPEASFIAYLQQYNFGLQWKNIKLGWALWSYHLVA